MPGVFEGGDLGGRVDSGLIFEEDVVAAVGVKGWVEVDEVYRLVFEVLAEDGEVVTVVEGVHNLLPISRISGGVFGAAADPQGVGATPVFTSFTPVYTGVTPVRFFNILHQFFWQPHRFHHARCVIRAVLEQAKKVNGIRPPAMGVFCCFCPTCGLKCGYILGFDLAHGV